MSTRQSPPAAGHDWAAELLSALLDGELDGTTAAAVTVHVQECAECSRDWDELRATKQLLAALPAAQAPRSYAILADDLGAPGRAGATFWPRLLGLTWRLSGALAVVLILIGTVQLAGVSPGEEEEPQYIQAEPQSAPAGPRGERAAADAAGAADAASAAVAVERVVEERVAKREVAGPAAAADEFARAPAPAAGLPTTASAPAPETLTAAPQREPAGPMFAPGVLWLIGSAVVVVVAAAAWLGERWVRGRGG